MPERSNSSSVRQEFARFISGIVSLVILAIAVLYITLDWNRSDFLNLVQIIVKIGLGIIAVRALWIAYQELERTSRTSDVIISVRRQDQGIQFPAGEVSEDLLYVLPGSPPDTPLGPTRRLPIHKWIFEVLGSNQGTAPARNLIADVEVWPTRRFLGEHDVAEVEVMIAEDSPFKVHWSTSGNQDVRIYLQFVGGQEVVCPVGQDVFVLGRIVITCIGGCVLSGASFRITAWAENSRGAFQDTYRFSSLVSEDPTGEVVSEKAWMHRFNLPVDPSQPPVVP